MKESQKGLIETWEGPKKFYPAINLAKVWQVTKPARNLQGSHSLGAFTGIPYREKMSKLRVAEVPSPALGHSIRISVLLPMRRQQSSESMNLPSTE